MSEAEMIPCPSCGAPITGRFCSNCGEKRLAPADLTVRHYFTELLHGFTHADGKLWKTLKAVSLRPGELSLAYMEGRRKRYMKPVALFFVLNLVYFLFPLLEIFNTGLNSQLHYQVYSGRAMALVQDVLSSTGADMDAFATAYTLRSSANAKLMLVLMVFLLAPGIALLYAGRMRHFSGHVALAFEVMIFELFWCTIVLGVLVWLLALLLHLTGLYQGDFFDDRAYTVIGLALNLHLFIGAGRRFYRCTLAGSTWRALLAFIMLFIAMNAYRFLLFLVTTWQVSHVLARQ